MVRGILIRGLGSDVELEDATQDVFFHLFARIGTLQKPEALRQFVASFAIRIVKWQLRKRRARRRFLLTTTGTLPESPGEAARYELRDVLRLFGELTPRQRDVMFLRHILGASVPEIGKIVGLSPSTIKRTLRLGFLQLSGWVVRAQTPKARALR